MAEIQIGERSAVIAGRGKTDRFAGFLGNGCRRVVVVRDSATPDTAASVISSTLMKKGIDCVFYTEIQQRSSSRDSENLASFIKKGFVQGVVALGGPRTMNVARLALAAVESGFDVDDILDGSVLPSPVISSRDRSERISYIEIPSSFRNPLMFTQYSALPDSRSRQVRVVKTGISPLAVIKDSSIYDRMHRGAFDSITLEMLGTAAETLCFRERHLFCDSLVALPLSRLFDGFEKEKIFSSDELSDYALCVDYAYSVSGPGTGYYISQTLNSLTGVPVSFVSAVLLPHLLEYYYSASPEAFSAITSLAGFRGEEGEPADAEDFIAKTRMIIKKKNLPIRLSETGIRKETLSSVSSLAAEYPDTVKPVLGITGEKISDILKKAF